LIKWFNAKDKEGKYISISNLPNAFKTGDVIYAENGEIPDSYVMKTVLKENNGMNVFIAKSSANVVTYEAFATFVKGNPQFLTNFINRICSEILPPKEASIFENASRLIIARKVKSWYEKAGL
jgi:hypothetical protein